VNKELYIDILRRLGDAVRSKRKEKLRTNTWVILQDNAPGYPSILVKDFLTKNNVKYWSKFHTLLTWLQLIFTWSLDWNHQWMYGAFVILLASLRMRLKSWKGFQKMFSRNVPQNFTVTGKSV